MKHVKKMIAPIIITALFVLYYVGIAAVFICVHEIPVKIRVLAVVVPLLLAAVMIGVLISRIKEIKGGQEDDLSKY